jgi:hypothetical protein
MSSVDQLGSEAKALAVQVRLHLEASVKAVSLQSVKPNEASATNSLDQDFVASVLRGDHLGTDYLSGI